MYKVLIVEDDPMVAMINEQYIARCRSFSVAGKCSDGKSALTFLEENKVDLIIWMYICHAWMDLKRCGRYEDCSTLQM